MRYYHWRRRLEYFTLFVPVRFYLVLFFGAGLVGLWWVNRMQPAAPSLVGSLIELCVEVILTAFIVWLVLGFLTTVIPFLLAQYHLKKGSLSVSIDNAEDSSRRNRAGRKILLKISPLLQPLFGYNLYRLVYDENNFSPQFSLVLKKRSLAWLNTTKEGWYTWPLPAVREYEVNKVIIGFEDLFRFYSFNITVPVKQSFYTRPRLAEAEDADISPQRTEEQVERIEELKRVDGELIHYKNFEANDDVRRIVWKVYARNKELVVRVPEILDPFASHIYLYPSFYDALDMQDNFWVQTRGLDYFKNACYTICHQLQKQEKPFKLIADQQLPQQKETEFLKQLQYQLAGSKWQRQTDLVSLIPTRGAAVVFVHSLSNADQIRELAGLTHPPHFIFIEISRALRRNAVGKWLTWLFIKSETDYEKQGFADFSRYTALRTIQQNEKKISSILSGADMQHTRISGKQRISKYDGTAHQ